MPVRHSRWRALTPALLLAGACLVGAVHDLAHAHGPGTGLAGELVYEMRLDLSLNPTHTDEAEPLTRIVHGFKADSERWPSAVSLSLLKDGAGTGTLCGGAVIDARWILTAAHCVFDRHRGGVRSLRAATAYTRSSLAHQGEPRRVTFVTVHPMFAVVPRPEKRSPGLVNDIALLELEAPTTAPIQKLLAESGQSAVLGAGTLATVVGWGLTNPRKPDERSDLAQLSKALLRADVPIVSRSACDAFLAFGGTVPTDPVFCAGDGTGGADTCNGDSGGPIFIAGPSGQPLQAGIVSWGDGCAYPGTYGAYTAVSRFEPWIRARVPQAQWVDPRDGAPALVASGAAMMTRPTYANQAGPVRLRIVGLPLADRQRIATSLSDATVVGEAEASALVWDAARQLVLNDQGQRIAEGVDAGQLQHAIERRRALERLIGLSAHGGLDVKVRRRDAAADAAPGATAADAPHKAGSRLDIEVGGVRDGAYLAVFNLTGNGKVELIAPAPMRDDCIDAACAWGARWTERGAPPRLEVEVRGPFGADQVVAVAGALPLSRMMPALAKAHGTFAVADVMAALAREQQAQPLQVGLRGVYSTRE
jgi:secreted trypsin-like serine protease